MPKVTMSLTAEEIVRALDPVVRAHLAPELQPPGQYTARARFVNAALDWPVHAEVTIEWEDGQNADAADSGEKGGR